MAEIIGTIGGFGSSVYFVPIAAFFLPFDQVLGLTALFHLFSNTTKITLFREGLDKRLLIYIGLPSIAGVIIGGWMSSRFDNVMLEYLLYSFLLLFAIFLLFRPEARWEPSLSNGIIGGSISGFVAGMLGTGGAIRGLTMSAFALSIQGFVATSAAIDLGVDLARSVVYYGEGYMVKEIWIYIPFLLFVSIIGSYIGKYILQFLNPDNFRRFSLGSIVIIAIAGWVRLIWFSAGSLLF
ncbi:MAG: sulfite exporter TauE/SafE family protein [Saprospiraceae bacterium]|nr:sulfite exporter TauE/SafE family protein [Saprospiraceae bacterium]MBP9194965.1 sulfite exporter TauE/SafE family protein [Saprospiraceae bacterium]